MARFGRTGEGRMLNRRVEVTALHRTGTEFPVELAITAIRLGGELMFSSAFLRVIAERSRLEEQLRQAQKMEATGRLASGVSSRLRPDDPGRRDIELIQASAERAAMLTTQLLAFSRKEMLEPKVMDLRGIATWIEPILRRLIGEDIDLAIVRHEGLGLVKADPGRIEQVILNLAINARDAMPRGGWLTIETTNVELTEA